MSLRDRLGTTDLLAPLALVVVLAAVAGIGFRGALVDWSFVWAPVVGAVGAGAVAWLAAWRRLLVGEAVALSLLAFAVVGIVVVGGGPTPDGVRTFLDGVVGGWADLLTSFTPADVTPEFRALPYTLSWLGALVGGELLRGTRLPGLPAIGPIVAMCVSLLFTVEQRTVALAQGVAIVGGTLLLGLVQQRQLRTVEDDLTTGSAHRFRGRGLALAVALLVGILALAPVLGPRLPLADANERFDLREYLTPPFDPLAIPSPLVGVKGELLDTREEEPVFTVRADEPIRRWTTAVLGAYDGVVWTVAESRASDAGQYRAIDSRFPAPPSDALPPNPSTVVAEVEVSGLPGVWLPRPGWPVDVDFGQRRDVRFNAVTGNAALPDGVGRDTRYTITAMRSASPSDGAMAEASFERTELDTDLSALPPAVRSLAADLLEGKDLGWPQVEAVRDELADGDASFYDSETTPPGHSYFRLSEFLADPERRIGYEEQYAAAAAVIARVAELPTRVAVGYLVPEDRWRSGVAEVVAGDVSAWIEVRTDQHGWVPIDVTPDTPRDPDTEEQGQVVEDVQIPNPPPPPPPPPDVDEPDRDELEDLEEEDEQEEDTGLVLHPVVLALGVGVGVPSLLLAVFAVAVIGLKRRRRTRRRTAPRPAHRVAGAWSEVDDRYREAGVRRDRTATTREAARVYGSSVGAESDGGTTTMLLTLADHVDRAAWAPTEPGDDEVAAAWTLADDVGTQLLAGQPWRRRWRMRLDPRPLLRRDPTLDRVPDRSDDDA